jgi:GGDEF domain-containing protein
VLFSQPIADLLKSRLFSYGGEEFLIVLNNCNPAFAESRAQEIRQGIPSRPVAPLPVH